MHAKNWFVQDGLGVADAELVISGVDADGVAEVAIGQ